MADKKSELIEIITVTLGVNKEDVKDDSLFVEDLGADSLDLTELILNIEDRFNIKIDDTQVGKFKKVIDVLDYLNRG